MHWKTIHRMTKIIACITFIAFLASCASGLERPLRDITIIYKSFEYIKTTEDGMDFSFHGQIKNPNEFSIRPSRFTYQVGVDGRHFEKGLIHIRGEDEQIGLILGVDHFDVSKLTEFDIQKTNAKLTYKSKIPFSLDIHIPFSEIGGLAEAMRREFLPYSIHLILTDERGKKAVLSHEANIGLKAILQPMAFENVSVTSQGNNTLVNFSLRNANGFQVTVDSCDYQLETSKGMLNKKIYDQQVKLPAHSRKFIKIEENISLNRGSPYRFQGSCLLKESLFSNSIEGAVE